MSFSPSRIDVLTAVCMLVGLFKVYQLFLTSNAFDRAATAECSTTKGSSSSWLGIGKNFGGRPQATNTLQGMQKRLSIEIRDNFGNYTDLLFNESEIINDLVITSSLPMATNRSEPISLERLKRRIKIKILEGQKGTTNNKFVWVTSGNSIAAGHGNLLHQSYSGVLERSMKAPFAAVGLDFEVRLRAYSGVRSAPEIALCMESYFGMDVDVLTWDFGQKDGRDLWRYRIFAQRAGLMPSMPTLLLLSGPKQQQIAFDLEPHGQSVLGVDDLGILKRRIPDSSDHPNPSELPPAVQYFLCKGSENTPPCNDYKYNGTPCEEVEIIRGRANWHPGWKENMLRGYVYSILLVEILQQTLEQLIEEVTMADVNDLLERYLADDTSDSLSFLRSYPQSDEAGIDNVGGDLYSVLLRGNALCHSMRQSSEARCNGLVDGVVGGNEHTLGKCRNDEHFIFETLPAGTDKDNVRTAEEVAALGESSSLSSLKQPWMVASDNHMRHNCTVTVAHDFADSFIVREIDGWMGDLYPNDRLQREFDRETERRGLVILCKRTYPFTKIPVSSCACVCVCVY